MAASCEHGKKETTEPAGKLSDFQRKPCSMELVAHSFQVKIIAFYFIILKASTVL